MTKRHYLLHRSIARISMVLQDMSPGDYALRPPVDLRLLVALPVSFGGLVFAALAPAKFGYQ